MVWNTVNMISLKPFKCRKALLQIPHASYAFRIQAHSFKPVFSAKDNFQRVRLIEEANNSIMTSSLYVYLVQLHYDLVHYMCI